MKHVGPNDVVHHASCTADYPEKPAGEKPQQIDTMDLGEGYAVYTCVDCGATVDNLPAENDPFWDRKVLGGKSE